MAYIERGNIRAAKRSGKNKGY